jgi:hypothetical protein
MSRVNSRSEVAGSKWVLVANSRSAAAHTASTCSASWLPSAVSTYSPCSRTSSSSPKCRRSRDRAALAAGWVTPSRSAARVTLRSRTSSRSATSRFRSRFARCVTGLGIVPSLPPRSQRKFNSDFPGMATIPRPPPARAGAGASGGADLQCNCVILVRGGWKRGGQRCPGRVPADRNEPCRGRQGATVHDAAMARLIVSPGAFRVRLRDHGTGYRTRITGEPAGMRPTAGNGRCAEMACSQVTKRGCRN